MQLQLEPQLHEPHVVDVIKHGKLTRSSYYDLLDRETSIAQAAEEALVEDELVRQQGPGNENLEVRGCAFSPEPHDYLAWTCGYDILRIIRVQSPSLISKHERPIEIEVGERVTALAFGSSASSLTHRRHGVQSGVYRRFHFDSTDNMLILAVGVVSGRIRIYDARDARFLFGLFDHVGLIKDLKFTQDGSFQLCSASADTTLKLWNMYDDGNMYMTLHGHVGCVNGCDWSPVAKLLCTVGSNRETFIWSTENYEIIHQLKGHLNDVSTCQFTPDGGLLATACFDTRVYLWNPYTGDLIISLLHLVPPPSYIYAGGHNGSFVRDLKWSANGDALVTLCDDGKLRVWSIMDSVKSSRLIAESTHRNGLRLAFSSRWKAVLVG